MSKENEILKQLSQRLYPREPKRDDSQDLSKQEYETYVNKLITKVQEFADNWGLDNIINEVLSVYSTPAGVQQVKVSYPGGNGTYGGDYNFYRSENRLRTYLDTIDSASASELSISVDGLDRKTAFANGSNGELIITFGQNLPNQNEAVKKFPRKQFETNPQQFHTDVLTSIVDALEKHKDLIIYEAYDDRNYSA